MTNGVSRPASVVDPVEVELERARWNEIEALVDRLQPGELAVPGYYADPAWSVKDVIAHLGSWMVEARTQLIDIAARRYVPREMHVDAMNAETLARTRDDPWELVWARTSQARTRMLAAWFALREPDDAANQWILKAGAEHYGEHLGRLREWVDHLTALRTMPTRDEWEP